MSESQVDRGEAELKGEAETRKEKPEETGSRRSEREARAKERQNAARSREELTRMKIDGGESRRRENVRIASEDFCIVLRNRESEDSVPEALSGLAVDLATDWSDEKRKAAGGAHLENCTGESNERRASGPISKES